MPLKKFWKRLFNKNEIEFQALKSRSAVELSAYNRKHKVVNKNQIPRFFSHYENLESSGQIQETSPEATTAVQQRVNVNKDDIFMMSWHNNNESPMEEGEKLCVAFCHMEMKRLNSEYLAETFNNSDEEDPNASKLFNEPTLVAAVAVCKKFQTHPYFREGVLLKSVESQSVYPYVHYTIFDQPALNNEFELNLCQGIYRTTLKNAVTLKYTQMHGVYNELSSMIHKSNKIEVRLPTNKYTGYILVAFKMLNVEHLETMERNWLDWTGAKDLYKCCPKSWNLKRMTFHKLIVEPSQGKSFVFVLMCEFANLMHPDNVVMGCDMVERLKMRYCGHVGLYKAFYTYTKSASNKNDWEIFEQSDERNKLSSIATVSRNDVQEMVDNL